MPQTSALFAKSSARRGADFDSASGEGIADGEISRLFRLPILRRRPRQMVRALRSLRRLEHHRRRRRCPADGQRRANARPRPRFRPGRSEDRRRSAAAPRHRHRRIRPRLRRRAGAGLGAAGRRRSRRRQIHPHPAGARALTRSSGGHAVYISGEEAMAQVRMRAARMGLSEAPVKLGAATCVEDILATLEAGRPPGIVAIDSIQTLWTVGAGCRARHHRPGAHRLVSIWCATRRPSARRCCWSAMSPRTARSPGPRRSSIWSMRCSISKASAAIISACCAR